MLISGQYKATQDGIFGYEIIISVKETEKFYILNLISNNGRYNPAHIDMLFAKSNKVKINKIKSQHAMRIWSDKDFTIYPFQAGMPFYFELMDDSLKRID